MRPRRITKQKEDNWVYVHLHAILIDSSPRGVERGNATEPLRDAGAVFGDRTCQTCAIQ